MTDTNGTTTIGTPLAHDELADHWQIEDSQGLTVVTGVWTPFSGDPRPVGIEFTVAATSVRQAYAVAHKDVLAGLLDRLIVIEEEQR